MNKCPLKIEEVKAWVRYRFNPTYSYMVVSRGPYSISIVCGPYISEETLGRCMSYLEHTDTPHDETSWESMYGLEPEWESTHGLEPDNA